MVLTNFECWAHEGSNDGFISSSHRRHNSSIDLFNPRNNCNGIDEKNNVMVQEINNSEQSATNDITINSNDQSINNVSHLSSNGYYGFAQICNVDTTDLSSSTEAGAGAGAGATVPLPSTTSETVGGVKEANVQEIEMMMTTVNEANNIFQQQQQQQHSSAAINVDCIIPASITGLATANIIQQTIAVAHGNEQQQQMDVDSGVGDGNKFSKNHCFERKKRSFVDEDDDFAMNAKRFRSFDQQHQDNSFSTINTSSLMMDHNDVENYSNSFLNTNSSISAQQQQQQFIPPTKRQFLSFDNTLRELNHDEHISTINYMNMNTSRINDDKFSSTKIKSMPNFILNKCNKIIVDDCKSIININSHNHNDIENRNNDQMEDLFWSIHGVSNHLILRHLSENSQDEI